MLARKAATRLPRAPESRRKAQAPTVCSGVAGTSCPGEEPRQDGLLGVKAVLRLLEHGGARAVDDLVRDLESAVRGEGGEDGALFFGEVYELRVQLVRRERLHPQLLLFLHPHGDPDVRVEDVRARGGLAGVVQDLDAPPVSSRGLPRLRHDRAVWLLAPRW